MNPMKNQLDMKIKTLRTNQGHEYLFDHFIKLYNERGIDGHNKLVLLKEEIEPYLKWLGQ